YGVLSAVMSMSPSKELALFMSQMGFMIGIMLSILSIIPLVYTYGTWGAVFWLSTFAALAGVVLFLVSAARMIRIILRYKLGFSSLVLLSSNWFFIRSPNRNNFFFITLLLVGSAVSFALGFLLPYTGEVIIYSPEWIGLIISAIGSALLSTALLIRARRKAVQLEAMSDEQ
ncbi:MAG: hypothetical protein ACFFD6_11455, partial [Candidatus Thorarchaeota archaeon]